MMCPFTTLATRFPVLLLGLFALAAQSAPVEFTLDEAQSKITLAGSVAGNALKEQGPGSLVTTFYGKILADVSDAAIAFTGGSSLSARTNGVWKPGPKGAAGSAPAAYAAQASSFLGTIQGALRDIVLDLTSASLPINNGQFDAAALQFAFPESSVASFDYDAGFLGADGVALKGISTNQIVNGATLAGTAGSLTLTIQVETEFRFRALIENDSSVRLTGKLVATQAQSGPTISSIKIENGQVILRVEGAGSDPRLDSSPDLKAWTTQTPTKTPDANGVTLSLPTNGPRQFYQVAK